MQILSMLTHRPQALKAAAFLAVAAALAALIFTTAIPGALAQSDRQAAPTGLTASAGQASGEVQVSWDAYPNTTKDFRLSWAKNGENFRKWSNLDFNAYPTGTSHLVTGLEDDAQYKFRIRARFDAGKSSLWTDVVYATPQAPAGNVGDSSQRTNHVETPQNLTVAPSSTFPYNIALVWDAPTNPDVSHINVRRTGGGLPDTDQTSTLSTGWAYNRLKPGQTYTFSVRFGTSSNASDFGPAAQATYTTPDIPAITGLAINEVEYDVVRWEWDEPTYTGLDDYGIKRRTKVPGLEPDVITNIASTTELFIDTGYTPGVTYIYEIYHRFDDVEGTFHEGPRSSIEIAVPDTLTVSVADASGTEGQAMAFTISLSRTSSRDVSFDIRTKRLSGDTAEGNDFTSANASPTITSGQTSHSFVVDTNQDSVYEGDETFTVEITSITNAAEGDVVAKGTILEDEQKPLVSFPLSQHRRSEDATPYNGLTLDIAGQPGSGCPAEAGFDVTLNISGTATPGDDYVALDTTVGLGACQSASGIVLTPVDDNVFELTQEAVLRIEPGPGYRVDSGQSEFKFIIDDNDAPPRLEVTALPGTEGGSNQGNTGTDLANAVFKLQLVGNTFEPDIFGDIEYIDGSAKVNEDFDYGSSVFAFGGDAPNPQYLKVPIIDDDVFDGPNRENFFVRFHNLNIHTNSVFIVEGNSMTVENFIIDNDDPAPDQDYVGSNTETLGEIRVGESWVNGNPVGGRIEYENDRDWYRTQLRSGHCYQVDIWGKTLSDEGLAEGLTLEDPSLWGIYDEDGYFVWGTDSDDGRGDNRTPRHTMKFRNGGTFYIAVSHDLHEFHGGGTFELSLIDLGTRTNMCTNVN